MSRLHEYKIQNLSYWTKGEKRYYDNYLINNGIKKKIKRQTILGQRICDFTLTHYGVRVEIDGKHHNTSGYKAYDKKRDRILFERYGWITLRIQDFNEKKASESIEYIKSITRNHMKRLQFIKKNIRDKDMKDINREKYSDEGKLVIDYYMPLYQKDPEKIKKEKTPIIKKEKIIKKNKIKEKREKINIFFNKNTKAVRYYGFQYSYIYFIYFLQ